MFQFGKVLDRNSTATKPFQQVIQNSCRRGFRILGIHELFMENYSFDLF